MCLPGLALPEQGPTLFFPSQRVFPARVRQAAGLQGAAGVVSPLGPHATTTASEAELLLGALSLQPGWFWLRLEDEAQGCAWCRGREAGDGARNLK